MHKFMKLTSIQQLNEYIINVRVNLKSGYDTFLKTKISTNSRTQKFNILASPPIGNLRYINEIIPVLQFISLAASNNNEIDTFAQG